MLGGWLWVGVGGGGGVGTISVILTDVVFNATFGTTKAC